jgi:cobalamin synthase
MVAKEQKKAGWFSKIASREDALKIIKDTSNGFFVVAAIQAALSFLVGYSILFDAALYAVGGFFLRKFNSRVAAVLLLLLAAIGAGVTFANKVGANLGGGNNIFLALIVLWAGVRAVEATFKLHRRFARSDPPATGADA